MSSKLFKLVPYLLSLVVVVFILLVLNTSWLTIVDVAPKSNSLAFAVNTTTTTTRKSVIANVSKNTEIDKQCPVIPPKLLGKLNFSIVFPTWAEIEVRNKEMTLGGRYKPKECISRSRVAIIIPYRQREKELRALLYHLHPILRRQQLEYGIYVIEQAGDTYFNRAMLFNIGFVEANLREKIHWQCFVFHDVDLLPEDDRNLYACPQQPRHMSVAVDKFKYKLPYKDLFGGVSALNKDHFQLVNGFSNRFWGWGGEDDDMRSRIGHHKLKVERYSPTIARYKMIKHKQLKANPKRHTILKEGRFYYAKDGLNDLKYKVLNQTTTLLYTKITVEVYQPKRTRIVL